MLEYSDRSFQGAFGHDTPGVSQQKTPTPEVWPDCFDSLAIQRVRRSNGLSTKTPRWRLGLRSAPPMVSWAPPGAGLFIILARKPPVAPIRSDDNLFVYNTLRCLCLGTVGHLGLAWSRLHHPEGRRVESVSRQTTGRRSSVLHQATVFRVSSQLP